MPSRAPSRATQPAPESASGSAPHTAPKTASRPAHSPTRLRNLLAALLVVLASPASTPAQTSPPATLAFDRYVHAVEQRLNTQHASPATFLAPANDQRLHNGEILVEPVHEPTGPAILEAAGGNTMLHHWRGTAFVPHAHAANFEHLLRDLPAYPQRFSPEVLRAAVLSSNPGGDHLQTALRVRQHHGLTVTLDTTYDLTFSHPNPLRGCSTSRSLRITEIANPNTPAEHPLSPADEHGLLLRLNTYWTWEERPDGLYLQIETVSLSRAIPTGLGWALRPYVDSIPRDSLTFTLRSARNALHP